MSCFDDIDKFREDNRYLNKDKNIGVRAMYENLWAEYINRYGVQTTYFRHGYKLETQDDFIYGEDPTEPYLPPLTINMMVEYQTDALLLSKFGLESTSDLNGTVSMKDFQNVFGLGVEPKAGDVIELTEASWLTKEMPKYDGLLSHYNIVANIDKTDIVVVSGDALSTNLAPVKAKLFEDELSYTVPLYTTTEAITSETYPIENELLEIPEHIISSYHIRIPINDITYFVPLYTPVGTIPMPRINTLLFNYDIVDINGADLISNGFFPFTYEPSGNDLLMPLYTYTEDNPVSATVILSADDLSWIDVPAKELLCMYSGSHYPSGAEYVDSISIELSAVYGSPFIRYPQLFELTEVKYQDFSQPGMNFGQGHYVWIIHAKRFDYSFEPGISSEGPMDQVYDNSFFGTLSTFGNEEAPAKVYPQNVEDASEEVWDYKNEGTNTDPYGYY